MAEKKDEIGRGVTTSYCQDWVKNRKLNSEFLSKR